jgi:SRSO17 transposase
MIREAQQRGMPYAWIGMDTHYGQQAWLLAALEADNECYIADIPCDTRVWLKCPQTEIPKRKGNRGRLPTKRKLVAGQPAPVEVRHLAGSLEAGGWQRAYVRDTERGELWARLLRVYPVRDELPGPETWLIIRADEQTGKRKYQFCNAAKETSFDRLAEMSHSRYWMERAIQDAKGEAGLDEYQVRGWRGWHHHMTLVIVAMLFLLELQLEFLPKAPLLTLRNVREILEVILPKREFSSAEILTHIEQKHRARDSARRSHHRRQQQNMKT